MSDDHETDQQAQAGPEATEAARELAAANMVDLEQITGTGAEGKITKADVEEQLAKSAASAAPPAEPETAPASNGSDLSTGAVYEAPTGGHAPKIWTGPRR